MKHYVGEIGTSIVLDTGITLTGASVIRINYRKPDGTTGYWAGSIADLTKISYTLAASNIDQSGTWSFQAYAEVSGGKWSGETVDIVFSALFDQTSLVPLKRVKDMVGLTSDQTTDDALLENLIMQETKNIQTVCRRDFFYNTYTEYRDGDGSDVIFVDNFPIETVTGIYDDTTRAFGAGTLIAAADYYVDTINGMIRLLNTVTTPASANVKIVYTGGYKVIPKDLELACAQMVVADYIELKGGVNAMEGETLTYKPGNLRKQADKIVDRYKKIIF